MLSNEVEMKHLFENPYRKISKNQFKIEHTSTSKKAKRLFFELLTKFFTCQSC